MKCVQFLEIFIARSLCATFRPDTFDMYVARIQLNYSVMTYTFFLVSQIER